MMVEFGTGELEQDKKREDQSRLVAFFLLPDPQPNFRDLTSTAITTYAIHCTKG
jgi:hypothetical protein